MWWWLFKAIMSESKYVYVSGVCSRSIVIAPSWSAWVQTSVSNSDCRNVVQLFSRSCVQNQQSCRSGSCDGSSTMSKTHSCCGSWSSFSSCPRSCGSSVVTRTRTCTRGCFNSGCEGASSTQSTCSGSIGNCLGQLRVVLLDIDV